MRFIAGSRARRSVSDMKLLALAHLALLAALGCAATPATPSSPWPYQLDESGALALAGDCVVVAEHASLVCVPRAGGGAAHELVRRTDRSFVAVAADGDDVLATSLSGGQILLDRVALDGTVTPLAASTATSGAGLLAVADSGVVLSTGSQLELVDTAGGVTPLAQASGIITALAVRGQEVDYADDTTLKTVDLMGDDLSQPSYSVVVALAADPGGMTVGTHLPGDTSYSFVQNTTTGDMTELHGALSRVAVDGGHPYAIVDGSLFDATGAVARQALAGNGDAFDLAVDARYVYWISRDGTLDRVQRAP